MADIPLDPEREHRIECEAVVDAYNETEQALGWYYYLERRLTFPFRAACETRRRTSPLRADEVIEVLRLADEDECAHEMMVEVRWAGDELTVPLAQLRPLEVDADTREAVEDWLYWVARGYEW